MDTIYWIRPSGLAITTKNTQEMIDHGVKEGWKLPEKKVEEKAKPKAKKVKKSDDDSNTDNQRSS